MKRVAAARPGISAVRAQRSARGDAQERSALADKKVLVIDDDLRIYLR